MSDAIVLDVADTTPVRLDVGDADPIAREEIAALAGRVTTVEGDVTALDGRMDTAEGAISALDGRMDAAEGEISTLGTTVDGIDARVEAIEADYVTAEDVMGALGGEAPALVAGSSRAVLGDAETASWMGRTTAADGAALIESVKGNTLVWNQLADGTAFAGFDSRGITAAYANGKYTIDGTTTEYVEIHFVRSFAMASGHKYLFLTNHDKGNTYGGKFLVYDKMNLRRIDSLGSLWSSRIFTADQTYEDCEFDFIQGTAGYEIHDAFTLSIFDLTAMFGAGNEPATVAEFEALYPKPYYPYDAGSLLSVEIQGVETVGFNQWDEQWELGSYNNTNGEKAADTTRIRCKNLIPVFPDTDYYLNFGSYSIGSQGLYICFYDANGDFLSFLRKWSASLTTPTDAYYMTWRTEPTYGTTYNHDICINLSDTSRNGEYEPYWSAQRAIPAATYFPGGMRSAGTVRDELTSHEAIHRVGEWVVDSQYCTRVDTSTDYIEAVFTVPSIPYPLDALATHSKSNFTEQSTADRIVGLKIGNNTAWYWRIPTAKQAATGTTLEQVKAYIDAHTLTVHYALATPTTTPIDPPLPLSYRTGAGGTERVMVAEGTTSAPPIFATRYPLDPADLAASIAPVDGPTAKTNHQVGDLIMLGFTLCKATQVIVTGETIAIGTNVTMTTVAAELAALSQ